MTFSDKASFIAQSEYALSAIYDELTSLPNVTLSSLDPQHTVLFVVDMINGFAKSGALSSPRVGAMVESIAALADRCLSLGIDVVAFADTHSQDSIELTTYPPHCLRDTEEAQVCSEIKAVVERPNHGTYTLIEKNSTNGFVEPVFDAWRRDNPHIETFLVVGDCTDICIYQFAVTSKAWYNTRNLPLRVLVPMTLTDTFDAPGHLADTMNAFALISMKSNGIEICKTIL